jgi:hypothetical protein
MRTPRYYRTVWFFTALLTLAGASTGLAQFSGHGGGGRHGGGGGGREQSSGRSGDMSTPVPQTVLTPHGGQYLATESNHYEVVYMPLQTRIYLYDDKMKPLSAHDLHVEMSLELPTETSPRHFAMQYVAMPAGSPEQDYVVASIDLRVLQDKETPITLAFSGLPDRKHPTRTFTPIYAKARLRPYVSRVLPTEADRAGVMRQRVCPVSGEALGTRGPIVKVYIADFPLYLCSEQCIETVRQSPEHFLPAPPRGP